MKIGIDIDGVLTDIHKFYLDYGSKYSYEKNLNGIVNVNELEIEDILGCDKSHHHRFWHKNLKYYQKKKYTRELTAEITKKLKQQGHEIHIITARHEDERKWTTKWLKENGINYNKLIMTEDKLEYILANNINLMIEDNVNNIQKISKVIPVICYDNPWNKEVVGENITRCYAWYEIYKKIEKMR